MIETPPGFLPLHGLDSVMDAFAPVYVRQEDDKAALGFRVGIQHCNPRGNCHGGTWATMADVLMGLNVGFASGKSGPTVSLSVDFLGAAAMGQWVEGRANILRWTHNLGFAECLFTADGEPALRANAVFRRKTPSYRNVAEAIARTRPQAEE